MPEALGLADSTDGVQWRRGEGPVELMADGRPAHEGSEVGYMLETGSPPSPCGSIVLS